MGGFGMVAKKWDDVVVGDLWVVWFKIWVKVLTASASLRSEMAKEKVFEEISWLTTAPNVLDWGLGEKALMSETNC